ncbi:MAG: hypothetical protein Q9227_008677 [Pyrenula ochraceoflavens]
MAEYEAIDQELSNSTEHEASVDNATRNALKLAKKRTKTGCLTCRKRRIKCGEEKPVCNNCIKSKRLCEGYNQRVVFKRPAGAFPSGGFDAQNPYGDGVFYGPGVSPGTNPGLPSIAPRPLQPFPGPPAGYGWQYDAAGNLVHVPQSSNTSRTPSIWDPSLQAQTFGNQVGTVGFQESPNSSSAQTSRPALQSTGQTSGQPPISAARTQYSESSLQEPGEVQTPSGDHSDYSDIQAQIRSMRRNATETTNRTDYNNFGFTERASFDMTLPVSKNFPLPQEPQSAAAREEYDDDDDPWDVEMDVVHSPKAQPAQAENDLSLLLTVHASHDERKYRTFTTYLNEPNVLATYRAGHSVSPLTDEKTARVFCHFVTSTGPSLSIYERSVSNPSMMITGLPIPVSQQALWTYTLPTMALNHPPLMHAILALGALHISKLQGTSIGPSIKHFQYALRRVSRLIGLPKRRHEVTTLATSLAICFYEVMCAEHSKWSIHLAGSKILVMEIDFASRTRMIRRMRAQAKARIAYAKEVGYGDPYAASGVPDELLPDKDWDVDETLVSGLTGFEVRYDEQWQANGPSYYPREELTSRDVEIYKTQTDLYWWYCKQDIFQSMISGNRLLMPYEHWIYCPPRGRFGRLDAIYATYDHLCLLMARLAEFGAKDQIRKRKYIAAHGGRWQPTPGMFGPPQGGPSGQQKQSNSGEKGASTAPGNGSTPTSGLNNPSTSTINNPNPSNPSPTGGAPGIPAAAIPSGGPGGPPMYGMMPPPPGPIQMPSAFSAMTDNLNNPGLNTAPRYADEQYFNPDPDSPPKESLDEYEAALQAALLEHSRIASAFDLFQRSITPEYQPLAPDAAPVIATPFGPALQYRTHHIACVWTMFFAGRILLHRMHPHQHPASMIAASMTTPQTMPFAQSIGKICAGLYFPQRDSLKSGSLNPSLGSALIESTFPLFFAAVQFQDPGQRGWTIAKLRDIARLTGWQSSAAIAAGCEVTWERMGRAGRGPAYTPTMDTKNRDERVAGKEREKRIKEGRLGLTVGDTEPRGEAEEILTGGGGGSGEEDWKQSDAGGKDKDEPPSMIDHGRNHIHTNANARVHWALGILSVEEDIQKLDLAKP